ncbi:MAG: phosphatase PAP2 family protein [Xanthobacteraceae bacterium]
MIWLKELTGFGNLAVLMPLATVMLLWLLLAHSHRVALWWAFAVVFCAGLTAVLKVFFYGCPPAPDLHSPSGHTSFSTLVYGAVTLATASQSRGVPRLIAIGVGAGFILAIAASRLLLHAHSAPEVVLGLAVGIVALALFAQPYRRCYKPTIWLSPLFVACGGLLLAFHGRELDTERLFQEIAVYYEIRCGSEHVAFLPEYGRFTSLPILGQLDAPKKPLAFGGGSRPRSSFGTGG